MKEPPFSLPWGLGVGASQFNLDFDRVTTVLMKQYTDQIEQALKNCAVAMGYIKPITIPAKRGIVSHDKHEYWEGLKELHTKLYYAADHEGRRTFIIDVETLKTLATVSWDTDDTKLVVTTEYHLETQRNQ